MHQRARFPSLLRLEPSLAIIGHSCGSCSRPAFPPDRYGCEQCGADASLLTPHELTPSGSVIAVVTVHRHHADQPEVPFTIATIELDQGVVLKGLIAGSTPAAVGDRVVGQPIVHEVADDGTELVDLHFIVDAGAVDAGVVEAGDA